MTWRAFCDKGARSVVLTSDMHLVLPGYSRALSGYGTTSRRRSSFTVAWPVQASKTVRIGYAPGIHQTFGAWRDGQHAKYLEREVSRETRKVSASGSSR